MPQESTPPSHPQDQPSYSTALESPSPSSALPIATPPTLGQPKSKKTLAIILILALILLATSGGITAYFYLKSQPTTPLPIQDPVSSIQDLESPTSTPDPTPISEITH